MNRRNNHWLIRDPEDVLRTKVQVCSRPKRRLQWGWRHAAIFLSKERNCHKRGLFTHFEGNEAVDRYCDNWEAVRLSAERRAELRTRITLLQNWLSYNMEMFWSKNSGLQTIQIWIWWITTMGASLNETNKSRHPNVTSFQAAIEAIFANMDKDALQKACQRFRTKIETKGSYIE